MMVLCNLASTTPLHIGHPVNICFLNRDHVHVGLQAVCGGDELPVIARHSIQTAYYRSTLSLRRLLTRSNHRFCRRPVVSLVFMP